MKKFVPIVVIVLILGLCGYKYFNKGQGVPPPSNLTEQSEVAQKSPEIKTARTASDNINIAVDEPVNAIRKGVIEVGASGFNAFVVDLDKRGNWKLVKKEFGQSLAYEGFANTDDVYSGLKTYLTDIFNAGVAGKNVHFVISSGALKNPKIPLIADAIQKKGYVVNRVTADEEGKYALKAVLPSSYKDNSFVVDIGSGNTKISWYEGNSLKTVEASGAKYYEDNKTDNDVYNEISQKASQIPNDKRKYCFIVGGVPYQLASGEGANPTQRFIQLHEPSSYTADNAKVKAGLNIYKAVYDATNSTFVFDNDANFTIGFLLSLN